MIRLLTVTPSFLLANLWFELTRTREQRVLLFALVTVLDLLALLIFLFQRQISRWHVTLTSDIEQAHGGGGVTTGEDKGQVRPRDAGGEPETPQTEARLRVMDELGYDPRAVNRCGTGTGSLQPNRRNSVLLGGEGSGGSDPMVGGLPGRRLSSAAAAVQSPRSAGWPFTALHRVQEIGDDSEVPELDQPARWSGVILSLGMDAGASSFAHTCSLVSAVSPTTIMPDIHPAFRPAPSSPGRSLTVPSRQPERLAPVDSRTSPDLMQCTIPLGLS